MLFEYNSFIRPLLLRVPCFRTKQIFLYVFKNLEYWLCEEECSKDRKMASQVSNASTLNPKTLEMF